MELSTIDNVLEVLAAEFDEDELAELGYVPHVEIENVPHDEEGEVSEKGADKAPTEE